MLKIKKISVRERRERFHRRGRKSRVYVSHHGENVLENFGNRASRPYAIYRKLVMPFVLAELGTDSSFNWDKYAGCSMCPCSPGFILNDHFDRDIFVTISDCAPSTDSELAESRKAQLISQL